MGLENLTQYQQLAVEGEVAYLLSKARHDSEALCFLYATLKDVPADFGMYIIEAAKNLLTLPEDKLDRVILEASLQQFPRWLWLDRTIDDLKLALTSTEMEQMPSLRVHIDKKEAKKMLIKSSFLRFCREVYVKAGTLSYELCERVLEERELEFLYSVAQGFMYTYTWGGSSEDTNLTDETFSLLFDIRNIMSFTSEKRALTELIKCEDNPEYAKIKMEEIKNKNAKVTHSATEPGTVTINIGSPEVRISSSAEWQVKNDLTNNDLEKEVDNIREKLSKTIADLVNESILSKKTEEVKYSVSKDYGERSGTSTLRVFDTKEEAENFVKQMEEQFPELLNTCKFVIKKEVHGRKEV